MPFAPVRLHCFYYRRQYESQPAGLGLTAREVPCFDEQKRSSNTDSCHKCCIWRWLFLECGLEIHHKRITSSCRHKRIIIRVYEDDPQVVLIETSLQIYFKKIKRERIDLLRTRSRQGAQTPLHASSLDI